MSERVLKLPCDRKSRGPVVKWLALYRSDAPIFVPPLVTGKLQSFISIMYSSIRALNCLGFRCSDQLLTSVFACLEPLSALMICVWYCRLRTGKEVTVRRVVPMLGVPDALVPINLPSRVGLLPGWASQLFLRHFSHSFVLISGTFFMHTERRLLCGCRLTCQSRSLLVCTLARSASRLWEQWPSMLLPLCTNMLKTLLHHFLHQFLRVILCSGWSG